MGELDRGVHTGEILLSENEQIIRELGPLLRASRRGYERQVVGFPEYLVVDGVASVVSPTRELTAGPE